MAAAVDASGDAAGQRSGSARGYRLSGKRVLVAGHRGMVGAALVRRLAQERCEVLTVPRAALDLRQQVAVRDWFARERPQAVLLSAATVGGILANDTRPAEFLYDNLMIVANVVEAARRTDCERLLFLGSSCIYPRLAPQPIAEAALLSGPLEPTNEAYAVAKIAGVKLCQAYRRQYGCDFFAAMPTNLYGPGDTYDAAASHVVPALIRKAHDARRSGAREMVIWGTGTPLREFLHVDDCADALVLLMTAYDGVEPVNVGSGEEITIADLARLVADVVGFSGAIVCDTSKPDGTPRKLMDSSRLRGLGWQPRISLLNGLVGAYADFLARAGEA